MAFTAVKHKKPQPKKRLGRHHTHNQHYIKHYWPYLPMAFIAAAGILLGSFWPSQLGVLGSTTELGSAGLLASTNVQRSSAHESSLVLNDVLSQAAQAKADDMVRGNYWSHISPDGRSPWSFITAAGYNYQKAGENLAYGFEKPDTTLNAWMHSPSHRANVLNRGYSQVGFGIAHSNNFVGHGSSTVIVAMYGSPATNATNPNLVQSQAASGIKGADVNTVAVSRVASLSGQNAGLLPMAAAALVSIAVVTFLLRHGRYLHKTIVRGEQLALRHPVLDFVLVAVIAFGFALSRTAGFIG
jgi:hypothetical protein